MLTRLKVTGFKNLVNSEIRLGPLTCIAGLNGVGKSNIFDAIHFLSKLADHTFVDAARLTRGGSDFVNLFTAGGDGRMCFECDLLIPRKGVDDFHQPAEATQTFLTYNLTLSLSQRDGLPRMQLEEERLRYVKLQSTAARLGFPFMASWWDSLRSTSQRRAPFISTENEGEDCVIRLSSDKMRGEEKIKRGGGRPKDFLARTLPRTVLSAAQNADEARTAVLARAEMRAWRNLHLEPSALRMPDDLQAPDQMQANGRHLAASLYRLARDDEPERVYAEVSNRLAELVDDVRAVRVERDDARRALQLIMTDRAGVELPASSLSDGTLRFVALSVLARDPSTTGLTCLEEPENGINPQRMAAITNLLRDLAVDPSEPVDIHNPLRQVVISTHSPVVAAQVATDDLVFADLRDVPGARSGVPPRQRCLVVRPIEKTWRTKQEGVSAVAKGQVIQYLETSNPDVDEDVSTCTRRRTVYEQLRLWKGS